MIKSLSPTNKKPITQFYMRCLKFTFITVLLPNLHLFQAWFSSPVSPKFRKFKVQNKVSLYILLLLYFFLLMDYLDKNTSKRLLLLTLKFLRAIFVYNKGKSSNHQILLTSTVTRIIFDIRTSVQSRLHQRDIKLKKQGKCPARTRVVHSKSNFQHWLVCSFNIPRLDDLVIECDFRSYFIYLVFCLQCKIKSVGK